MAWEKCAPSSIHNRLMKEKKLDGLGEKLTREREEKKRQRGEKKMKKKMSIDRNLGCLRCCFFLRFSIYLKAFAHWYTQLGILLWCCVCCAYSRSGHCARAKWFVPRYNFFLYIFYFLIRNNGELVNSLHISFDICYYLCVCVCLCVFANINIIKITKARTHDIYYYFILWAEIFHTTRKGYKVREAKAKVRMHALYWWNIKHKVNVV